MEWKPIETAPTWKTVIVFDPKSNKQKSCGDVFCAVKVDDGTWTLSTKLGKLNPTHWMPLPEAPNAEVRGCPISKLEQGE